MLARSSSIEVSLLLRSCFGGKGYVGDDRSPSRFILSIYPEMIFKCNTVPNPGMGFFLIRFVCAVLLFCGGPRFVNVKKIRFLCKGGL